MKPTKNPTLFLARDIFVELMQLATSSVEFSFDNNMHRQIDGVAKANLTQSLTKSFQSYWKMAIRKM